MDSLTNDYAAGLLNSHEPPCLSLYQPTHRHRPDNAQDPIRFRNLIKSLDESLRQKFTSRQAQPLLEPFLALAENREFWMHTLDGLAVLGAPNFFRVYRLQRPVVELAVVAESFHIKPLFRILQSADRYQVLGLDRQKIKLFEGNRDALDEIDLAPGIPATIKEALGEELTEPHQTVASYGMGAGGTAMRHGHGSKKDELDKDAEKFFRAVDRAILQHHSKPSGLPLILAALTEYHSTFRQVSQNPFLLPEGIETDPSALSIDTLRERAWRVVEPRYLTRLTGFLEEFGAAKPKGLGAEDPSLVAEAAIAGRVGTLLIEADRHIPGRIDYASGRIEPADLAHPEVNDLLDDLGDLVLKKGGQIVIVPSERMPTPTGVAALYRF
jgi:hypothetical protein